MKANTLTSPSSFILPPGARVIIRDEEWIVRQTRTSSNGGVAVHVTGLSELVRGKQAIFLSELDPPEELRPESTRLVHDKSPRFRRSRLYLESLLRRTPPTDPAITVGHRAAMSDAPYQLVPAARALSKPRARILIADDVGIGKTVEVGILLSELIRRGRGQRILVVALKSLLGQLQQELWARFTIPLVRLDSRGIARVRAKIPASMNPFHHYDRVIISIDTLKHDLKYRAWLERTHWDVVVIDECQNVADRSSGSRRDMAHRARLAKLLATTCDSLILTSATPHDGRRESFASIISLLEPTVISDPSSYTKQDIQDLLVRRFKKDIRHQVEQSFPERVTSVEPIHFGPEERAAFDAIARVEFQTLDARKSGSGILFRTTLLKAFLSSPQAAIETIRNRKKTLAAHQEKPTGQRLPDRIEHDRRILDALEEVLGAITPARFGKLKRLRELLGSIGYRRGKPGERVVIFSERIETLKLLRSEIQAAFELGKDAVRLFHGTLPDHEQQDLVKAFGVEDSAVRILLASDAASEGINLHYYCHRLLHFDLPWSLITLEQRNGRIDRFGQTETPHIHYLLGFPEGAENESDLQVLKRLIDKENEAHQMLGDVASLMNLREAALEEERVALGIQEHQDPRAIVPDTPALEGSLFDLFSASEVPPAAETASLLSLYADDLEFAREAFDTLVQAEPDAFPRPEWHANLSGFTFVPPLDLEHRLERLPPELRTESGEFKLTADRSRVMRALEEARGSEERFPEWQLFWELHPVAEWLNDRVLAYFRRHEAPVIETPWLRGDEVAYVFQGVLSNLRSQPVLVDWFAVVSGRRRTGAIEALRDLVERAGLRKELTNKSQRRDLEPIAAKVADTVEAARAHMLALRKTRAAALLGQLKEEDRRARAWHKGRLAQIEAHEARLTGEGRALRDMEVRRLADRRSEAERILEDRRRYLTETLETIEEPYLRLALVVTGREEA